MDPSYIPGIFGGAIGVLGGAIGTYYSIKNTNGPRERQFMIRCSVVVWVFVTGFLVGLFLIPAPYKWLLWIPYGVGLTMGIRFVNNQQQRIRSTETLQLGK